MIGRTVADLPGRYRVSYSFHKGEHYLNDGSNWTAWIDGLSDAQVINLAHADIARRETYVTEYAAARAAATDGWSHADCDHAHGICQSPAN